ncbi:hypothetical protein GGR52DRAFT_587445, partial [Hypoxylon sp. FL1284]
TNTKSSHDQSTSTKSSHSQSTGTTSSRSQSTSTKSESSCTQTKTASDCAVTCKPTVTASTHTSITCFTTACSKTTTGCSVTGTTTTTTSTTSCRPGPSGVGRRDDSCHLACPEYDVPHDSDDSDDSSDDDTSDKRDIMARAPKNIEEFSGCTLTTPAGMPVTVPSNPPGGKFWNQDKIGFKHANGPAKAASQAVPRWYSTTVDAAACTPTVVKVGVANYPDGGTQTNDKDKKKVLQRATMDHSWEKGWLTDFFGSIIDNSAPDLSGVKNAGSGKMTCADFNKYIFGSGSQNLIDAVYKGLPSKDPDHLDYIGMTDNLNADCKGAVSNPDAHLKNRIPSVIALDVTDPNVNTALDNMNQKFTQLERIRLGVHMTNLQDNKRIADKTNTRLQGLIQDLDKKLAAQYTNIDPFKESNWFFSRQFQKYMDNIVADSPGTTRREVNHYGQSLKSDIESKMKTLQGRQSQLVNQAPDMWSDIQTKWGYYKNLGNSAWDMDLSWNWGCGRKRDGTNPACELPHPSSSASNSSSATSTRSSPTSSRKSSTHTTSTGSHSAHPSHSSKSVPVTTSSASKHSTSHHITSTFVTSTRSNSCTYATPSLTGNEGPYCSFYVSAHSASQCNCNDGKTYSPYTGGTCQPVCPLTSPGHGYTEMKPPPTKTSSFKSFTTTDVGGNVEVCTSLSAVGNGIPGSVCISPTIRTASTTSSPTPSLIPQGQKTCYTGSEYQFNRDDAKSKIEDICKNAEYWMGVRSVYSKGEIKRYNKQGDETDDGKVTIAVQEVDRACPKGMDLQSEYTGSLNSDVCIKNLMGVVDGCDTDSGTYKRGGILWANCLSWEVRVDPS